MSRSARRPLDAAYLERQTFGDRDLERELLRLFDGQCRRLLPAIKGEPSAIARRDAAHALKGAARAVGAERTASLADRLETALAEARPETLVEPLATELEGAISEVRREIARKLGSSPAAA